MNLKELALPPWKADAHPQQPAPARVTRFMREAERRIDALFASGRNRRLPRFIPADAGAVYAALEHITREDLPVGRVFCEWGSGFGVATCLASLLGYNAWGIEIEQELVEHARALISDQDIAAHILNLSYLPEGFEAYAGSGATELLTPEMQAHAGTPRDNRLAQPPARYEGMPCDTDEIDVFYVYPWPGEQEMMLELFDHLATDGAILLCYLGDGEMAGYQQIGDGW